MTTKKKGVFIMSLNSQRLKDAIANNDNPDFRTNIDGLDIFVFDSLEVLNGIFFNEENAGQVHDQIEGFINTLENEFVGQDSSKRKLIRYTNYQNELNPILPIIYQEIYSNAVFKSHCKNQIFRNLQPKLKRAGIKNNRSYLIDLLVPFLAAEIALFLQIFSQDYYQYIYGMESEMEIIKAIKNRKYAAFTRFLNNDINYIQLPQHHA